MEELEVRSKNWILSTVNCRMTPEEAGLKTPAELTYYREIRQEAQLLYERGGKRPVFTLFELD